MSFPFDGFPDNQVRTELPAGVAAKGVVVPDEKVTPDALINGESPSADTFIIKSPLETAHDGRRSSAFLILACVALPWLACFFSQRGLAAVWTPKVDITAGAAVKEEENARFRLTRTRRDAHTDAFCLRDQYFSVWVRFYSKYIQRPGQSLPLRQIRWYNYGPNKDFSMGTVSNNKDEPTRGMAATIVQIGCGGGHGSTATVTVIDDDPTTVMLAGTADPVGEGGSKKFTVTLGRGLVQGEALEVPLTFGGTATRNTDYTVSCPSALPTGVTCQDLNNVSVGNNPRVTFTGPSSGATATLVTLTLSAVNDSTEESGGETVESAWAR